MKRLISTAIVCAGLGAAAAGCGSGDPAAEAAAPGAAPTATRAAAPAAATSRRGASVRVGASRYGRMLFDGRGRALYLFTRDTRRSRCYGACASAWPPFLTRGTPRARGSEARAGLIGSVRRRDGSRQVTYRGQPLYYYVGDTKPGQVLCQNVVEFGGTWLVVAANGDAIR